MHALFKPIRFISRSVGCRLQGGLRPIAQAKIKQTIRELSNAIQSGFSEYFQRNPARHVHVSRQPTS